MSLHEKKNKQEAKENKFLLWNLISKEFEYPLQTYNNSIIEINNK